MSALSHGVDIDFNPTEPFSSHHHADCKSSISDEPEQTCPLWSAISVGRGRMTPCCFHWMLSLPEDAVTTVQRKGGERGKDADADDRAEANCRCENKSIMILLVSKSVDLPPNHTESRSALVCCKRDKWGRIEQSSQNRWERECPTRPVSQMLCSHYSVCSLHILA